MRVVVSHGNSNTVIGSVSGGRTSRYKARCWSNCRIWHSLCHISCAWSKSSLPLIVLSDSNLLKGQYCLGSLGVLGAVLGPPSSLSSSASSSSGGYTSCSSIVAAPLSLDVSNILCFSEQLNSMVASSSSTYPALWSSLVTSVRSASWARLRGAPYFWPNPSYIATFWTLFS